MSLSTPLDEIEIPAGSRLAVTIGVFDGVHIGHQALIHQVTEFAANRLNTGSAALTFDPHPAAVFSKTGPPLLLGTVEERAELLLARGLDRVIVAPFDANFADQTKDTFVRTVLVDHLHAAAVVVGEDFRYGRNRLGNVETLRRAGDRHDFAVIAVPQVVVGGIPARSTEIRKLIAEGDVVQAAALLGQPFLLCGSVVHGHQLGRTIGFPTANLLSDAAVVVPGPGIYAGAAYIAGKRHRAAISVGNNPTVAPEGTILPRTVEAFLLDGFDRDIYGLHVCFEFLSRLRGMEKFTSLDALVLQMQADVREIMRRFN